MWKDGFKTKGRLFKRESRQVVYGFRSEDVGETNSEKDFWANRGEHTQYPFVFFVMLQFEDFGRKNLNKLINYRKQVEDEYNKLDGVKGITYLTLDNSDMLLVLRSSNYDEGAGIIDDIHRKRLFYATQDETWNVKYSFTIPGIDKHFLKTDRTASLKNYKLHRAQIYAIEIAPKSIDKFYEILKERLVSCSAEHMQIEKKSILGYNDEMILLTDVSWDKFLELYKDTTGVLNHSSSEFQKHMNLKERWTCLR